MFGGPFQNVDFDFTAAGDKRRLDEMQGAGENKKRKIEGDVKEELVTEILTLITDPEQMVGPDVSNHRYITINQSYSYVIILFRER